MRTIRKKNKVTTCIIYKVRKWMVKLECCLTLKRNFLEQKKDIAWFLFSKEKDKRRFCFVFGSFPPFQNFRITKYEYETHKRYEQGFCSSFDTVEYINTPFEGCLLWFFSVLVII